jgi:type I restriction enzyme S subunit
MKQVQFEEVLKEPIRNGLTKPKAIRGSGVKMISMGEIFAHNRISKIAMDRVPVTDKEFSNCSIKAGDLLFARQSLVLDGAGKCSIVTEVTEDTVFESHLIRARIDGKKANPYFLYYYFNSHEGRENIKTIVEQVAAAGIRGSDLIKLWIPCPDIDIQNQVASILDTVDRKIELNRKVNDNLQQQAFAAFDNLVANAENTDCNVSDYAFLNPKRALAKNQMARSIDMSRLSTSRAFPSGWEMKPFAGGMRFTNGDTLLARITPCLENGKTAFIDFLDDGEVAFGSTEYIVLAPKNDTPPEMLYCLARNPAFIDYAVKNMNGSSGRQRVSAETVGQYRLPLFDKHSLSIFREVVSPMFLKMRYNSLENMRLAELRDELLPKLMSGEIGVSNIRL